MPDTEDESVDPDYKEFCQMLLDGQRRADDLKRSYFFTWRGYKACISNQIPKLTTTELKRRFNLAMQYIKKKEEEEGEGEQFFYPTQKSENPQKEIFRAPEQSASSSSSGSQQSSSSSLRGSSDSLLSEEPTQIPETQFQMNGKYKLFF